MEGIVSVIVILRFYSNMRCLKCVYNAKVAYVNLVMYCGARFYREISLLRVHLSYVVYGFAFTNAF